MCGFFDAAKSSIRFRDFSSPRAPLFLPSERPQSFVFLVFCPVRPLAYPTLSSRFCSSSSLSLFPPPRRHVPTTSLFFPSSPRYRPAGRCGRMTRKRCCGERRRSTATPGATYRVCFRGGRRTRLKTTGEVLCNSSLFGRLPPPPPFPLDTLVVNTKHTYINTLPLLFPSNSIYIKTRTYISYVLVCAVFHETRTIVHGSLMIICTDSSTTKLRLAVCDLQLRGVQKCQKLHFMNSRSTYVCVYDTVAVFSRRASTAGGEGGRQGGGHELPRYIYIYIDRYVGWLYTKYR